MNLLKILFLLFLALAVIVMVTERYSKPMSQSKQAKLSRIAIFLVFGLVIARIIHELV